MAEYFLRNQQYPHIKAGKTDLWCDRCNRGEHINDLLLKDILDHCSRFVEEHKNCREN